MIQHLVISGGGAAGLVEYGALKYLAQKDFWDISNVKTIYSTSIGSYIAIIISLGYDWESLDDYVIKRPWDKDIPIKADQIANFLGSKGIFDQSTTRIFLEPLLVAKDLSVNITMQELYDYTHIEIHIYATNLNGIYPTSVDISYKTHPDLEVYKVIYMSSAIPFLFKPSCDLSNCYIDGSLFNNFPLNNCINDVGKIDEILAIKVQSKKEPFNIDYDTDFFNYLTNLFGGIQRLVMRDDDYQKIENIVYCNIANSYSEWGEAFTSSDVRESMITSGYKFAEEFLDIIKEPNSETE